MPTASSAVSGLGKGEIALLLSNADNYSGMPAAVLSPFAKKKNFYGVYVAVNKPYATLMGNFSKARINTERLFFIDAVTKMVGGAAKPGKNFLAIESPQFLTEMSIAISQAMDTLPKGERYFILDSVSSMLIYNSPGTIARFMHFLSGKLREWGARGVFLAVDKEVDALLPYITQFVDKTVHVR
jgi:hypothetical protein